MRTSAEADGMTPVRDLEPALLRAFLAIVDAGNFSRASSRLNRTQSALSMQIKRLEGLVDAELFDRSSRPPRLTLAGEKLVATAREIMRLNDSAVQNIRSEKISGKVRFGLMEDLASTSLGALTGGFIERHPSVQLDVETGLTRHFVNELGTRFDLVLSMVPEGTLQGEFIMRGRSVWGAAPGFKPSDFDVLPLALYQTGCYFREWSLATLDRAGIRWRMGLTSTSIGAISDTVRDGWCISAFKNSIMPAGLVELGPEDGLPALPDFELRLFRSPVALSAANQAFAEHIAEFFRNGIDTDSTEPFSQAAE